MSETDEQSAEPQEQEPDPGQVVLEQRARRMGWRPREEFEGLPERWLPPDQFVERGEQLLPLLQERNRAADRTIQDLQTQVRQQGAQLQEMLTSTRRAEEMGYRRAMAELNEKRDRAVETGDTVAFRAVEQAMRELGPPPPQAPQQPPQAPQQGPQANTDPVIAGWVQRNAWFRNDPVANVAMIAAMQQAEREMPTSSVEEHLVAAERVIRRRFPEHFPQVRSTNGSGQYQQPQERRPLHMQQDHEEEPVAQPPRREAPVSRSSESAPTRRPGPRSFEAMPRDVQAQFERQRKALEGKGDPLTREEFARYYFEQEPEV